MKRISVTVLLLILTVSFSVLVGSCVTTGITGYSVPNVDEAAFERIAKSIELGFPMRAVQDILALRRMGTAGDGEELDRLLDGAGNRAIELFGSAIESGDYLTALDIYRSAEFLGEEERLSGWTMESLEYAAADALIEQGALLPALFRLYSLAERTGSGLEIFDRYSDTLFATGSRGIARLAVELLEKAGREVTPELTALASRKDSTSAMLKGVVTVWVNRGIRIENGVGRPDRIIGSGFFIDGRGYLITNYHVIESEVNPKYEGFSRLFIRLSDDPTERIPAQVVAWDRVLDLALLKAEVEPEYTFSFSLHGDAEPGSRILAIGSPGGLENTITSGIVSAVNRRFLQIGDAMQVDVPINPGNSGGPLLDDDGDLIGVVFAGIEQFEGINFAIPSDWVIRVLPALYKGGEYVHSWIGAALSESRNGLEVMYPVPGEPAMRAGIERNDIIRSIGGKPVRTMRDAQIALMDYRPETLVPVLIERDGGLLEVFVSTAARPFSPIETALERDIRENVFVPLFGMALEYTGKFLWEKSYIVSKVYTGSIADETGISVNDPLSIQGWSVDTDSRIALLQILVKKRKAGFIESGVQLGSYLEIDNFI